MFWQKKEEKMFSGALFKQSMKANWVKWTCVTVATCAMLAIVIIVLGSLAINDIRDSLKSVFQDAEMQSVVQENAIDGYTLSDQTLEFENTMLSKVDENETTLKGVWSILVSDYDTAIDELEADGMPATEEEKEAVRAEVIASPMFSIIINQIKNNIGIELSDEQSLIFADCFLRAYDADGRQVNDPSDENFVDGIKRIFESTYLNFLYDTAYQTEYDAIYQEEMAKEDAIESEVIEIAEASALVQAQGARDIAEKSIETYKNPEITLPEDLSILANEIINDYMFNQVYTESVNGGMSDTDARTTATAVKVMSNTAISTYEFYLNEEDLPLEEGQTQEEYAKEQATRSITDQIPEDVASALEELGNMDIYGLIIGSIFYQIAGLLLPMVYVIMVANGLLAGQVDSGSMAYVLSTPIKRRTVTVTQMAYLMISLFCMFALVTVTSVISIWIVGGDAFAINFAEILLLNLGAFLTMFAFSGFCFMCSALFNRTKHSLSIGGGISIFMLVCTILGLFGSSVVPAAMRIDAMNVFNYVSIITLFDTVSILNGGIDFLWKFAILAGIGIITFIIGVFRFDKKDLPL